MNRSIRLTRLLLAAAVATCAMTQAAHANPPVPSAIEVVGARVDGVNVDPTAIDWLLLSATPAAPGLLAATTFIQRVNTTGGLIPAAADCNASTVGTTSEVPYTADFYFWKARRGGKGARD